MGSLRAAWIVCPAAYPYVRPAEARLLARNPFFLKRKGPWLIYSEREIPCWRSCPCPCRARPVHRPAHTRPNAGIRLIWLHKGPQCISLALAGPHILHRNGLGHGWQGKPKYKEYPPAAPGSPGACSIGRRCLDPPQSRPVHWQARPGQLTLCHIRLSSGPRRAASVSAGSQIPKRRDRDWDRARYRENSPTRHQAARNLLLKGCVPQGCHSFWE